MNDSPLPAAANSLSQRSLALDVFRGLTIAAMTLVNNPGSWAKGEQYAPLAHAAWHGWTPTDLIFPFFVFIVGVASEFAFAAQRARGMTGGPVAVKVVRRSIIIVLLGLWLGYFLKWDFATLRFPGVLQRIGLCYLLGAPFAWRVGSRGILAAIVLLLVAHTVLLRVVPVPGFGAANLDPDTNLGAWLDRLLFSGHLYRAKWDPEGLLGTLTALGTALSGVLAGRWMRRASSHGAKVGGLVAAGAVLAGLGLAAEAIIPINKPLWTASYVLLTSGLGCVTLGLAILACDWKPLPGVVLTPFVAFGRNAILFFVLEGMVGRLLSWNILGGRDGKPTSLKAVIYERGFLAIAQPINASLLYALSCVAVFGALALLLHRRRLYLKV